MKTTIKSIIVLLMAAMSLASCEWVDSWEIDNNTGKVKLKAILVTVEGLTNGKMTMPVGGEFEVTYKAVPENADNPQIVISSNNKELITIDGNKIKALAPGEVTITITSLTNPTVKETFTLIIPDGLIDTGGESNAVDQSAAESRRR